MGPSDPRYKTKDYADYLKVLDWKLRKINTATDKQSPLSTSNPDIKIATELYRQATVIYLRRASAGILNIDETFTEWIKQAFEQLAQLPTCPWPFPLLIFGCEADTDEERIMVLDLISRTEKSMQVPNLKTVERTLQTIWVQEDLFAGDLDYVRKLGIILSTTHSTVPAFI